MSSPVHVYSRARSKTALRLPSELYLMKTNSWAEFNISVDSSDCEAYFPFLTLIHQLALYVLDHVCDAPGNSPVRQRHWFQITGWFIYSLSPIVCGFFACAIKYATSYDALWAAAGIVYLFSKDFILALQLSLVLLIRVLITSWVNKEKEKTDGNVFIAWFY